MENLQKIINILKSDALFNISLTAKELFHSNFLAWLLETYPEYIAQILDLSEDIREEVLIKREMKNIDIAICDKSIHQNPLIIIENKVKDIITNKQLEVYDKKFEQNNIHKIILTLADIKHKKIIKHWHIITYKKLSKNLAKIKFDFKHEHHKVYIQNYIVLISRLADLFDEALRHTSSELWLCSNFETIKKQLETIKFHDVYIKFLASQFSESVRRKVLNDPLLDEIVTVQHSFHRTQPATHISICNNNNFALGISIEGKQYRRVIQDKTLNIPKQSDKKNREIFEKNIKPIIKKSQNFIKIQKWLNEDYFQSTNKSRRRKEYCAYHPYHIYKYNKINSLDLIETIKNDVEYGLSIIKEN